VQYLEHFMQKYALPGEPGYFLGSEYSYAETVSGPCQQMPCCFDCIIHVCHIGVKSTGIKEMCCSDKVTTPFVRRAVLALPSYRSVDLLSITDTENLPRLKQWMKVTSTSTRSTIAAVLAVSGNPGAYALYRYVRRLFWTARATRRLAPPMKSWSRAWRSL
jgi:hypothetical protein